MPSSVTMETAERREEVVVMPGRLLSVQVYDEESGILEVLSVACDADDKGSVVYISPHPEDVESLHDLNPDELFELAEAGQTLNPGIPHDGFYPIPIDTLDIAGQPVTIQVGHMVLMSPDISYMTVTD